ncbi:MAG: sigma-70 family RNA polymerase sigma factor [Planctomycetota bacterium]|jgi:RNA polymerase sigma factor (TIGR02999 family)
MTPPTDQTATRLLSDLSGGRAAAAEELLPLVYEELRGLAQGYLRRERADHTLAPTALVHEAWMKLIDQSRVNWQGEAHFKAIAAQAMRRILIDHARGKKRDKRGGGWRRLNLDEAHRFADRAEMDAIEFYDAIERMRTLDERQARITELRIFGGMTSDEIADQLSVSSRTVERDWKMAQAWLRREFSDDRTGEPKP